MVLTRVSTATVMAVLALVGAAGAQSTETIGCEAILIEYESEFPWTEQDGDTFADFIAPFATFSIRSPERHEGRRVRIVFLGSKYEGVLPESGGPLGDSYALELPADYFDGPDGQVIRSFSVLSISRSEPSE